MAEASRRADPQSGGSGAPGIILQDAGATAFVGRCLRGPLHQPTCVRSFEEFQRNFGGLWQLSMLSYAVEQYFAQGGGAAVIVRVANGARAPSIRLPTADGSIVLRALLPGTREYLRAAVDYDGIPNGGRERFNLTIQRLRVAGTEQIEAQESYRQLSCNPATLHYVGNALATSGLVRFEHQDGHTCPEPGGAPGGGAGYYLSASDGDDGEVLSDHDLIGAADAGTGLQALLQTEAHFSLLYLPPLEREREVGVAALLVAARICRERNATLIIDPPAGWCDVETALRGLADWPLQLPQACMFFPRLRMQDRLRGRHESFGNGGAVAGMLARAEKQQPLCGAAAGRPLRLLAAAQPLHPVTAHDAQRLARRGANALDADIALDTLPPARVTLVQDNRGRAAERDLDLRRLGQLLACSVERGTRWAAGLPATPALWQQLRLQVGELLESVALQGGLVGERPEDSYVVICDARLNGSEALAAGELYLLYGIATTTPGEFSGWLLTLRGRAARVRQVSIGQLFDCSRRSPDEVETVILRGLISDYGGP